MTLKLLGALNIWAEINNANEETVEIKARFLASIKAYSCLQTIFRSKQIFSNNIIILYKTLMKPLLCYGCVTWTLTQMADQMLCTFERKILRRMKTW
jgi:hypothetical protein